MLSRSLTLATVLTLAIVADAQAGRITCEIDVSSDSGGRLEVVTWDYGPDTLKVMRANPAVHMMPSPATISWHPPSSSASVDLEFFYGGSDLSKLEAPTFATASFAPLDGVKPEHYAVTVISDDARPRHFTGAQTDFMTDDMRMTLADASPAGFTNARSEENKISVLALSQSSHTKVAITGGDHDALSSEFDTSATKGRDQLLAYARHLVETQDPRVCRERK